jgi:hypothetical protein
MKDQQYNQLLPENNSGQKQSAAMAEQIAASIRAVTA